MPLNIHYGHPIILLCVVVFLPYSVFACLFVMKKTSSKRRVENVAPLDSAELQLLSPLTLGACQRGLLGFAVQGLNAPYHNLTYTVLN